MIPCLKPESLSSICAQVSFTHIYINGQKELIVSERLITGYCHETEEQESARIKAGKPWPTYQFVSVKTKLIGAKDE